MAQSNRHGKANAASIVILILCVVLGGVIYVALQEPKTPMEKEVEVPEEVVKPEPKPEPKPDPKPEPKLDPKPEPKPKPKPDPKPIVKEKSEVDLYLEEKYPLPKFQPLEKLVKNWKKVPKRAFPKEVTSSVPCVYTNRSKTEKEHQDANHLAKPVKLVAGTLTLSSLNNSKLISRVNIDETDFKARVRDLYYEKIEKKTKLVLAKREAHRSEAIAYLEEAREPVEPEDEIKSGSRSSTASYSRGDYWKNLSPSAAGEVIFGEPEDESGVEFRDAHAMYHRGDIVFTPLGQLDGYAIASRKYAGLLLYSIEKGSLLAKAGIQQWDLIYKVNKATLPANPDERYKGTPATRTFAKNLIEAEETGATLTLYVKRNAFNKENSPEKLKFDIKLTKKGSLSPYLERGKFTDRAAAHSLAAVNYLLDTQREDGSWKCGYGSQLSTTLAGTHLIMAAEQFPKKQLEILRALKKSANYLKDREKWDWSWDHSSASWFLAEYFWATGDHTMYPTLHRYLSMLDESVNPLGGVTHKAWEAPYGSINLGGPSGLARMAFKAAKVCRAANYSEFNASLVDTYVFKMVGNDNTGEANRGNYMGDIGLADNIGAEGMNTGAFLAGTHRVDYGDDSYGSKKKKISSGMYELLKKDALQANHIHGTPSLGTIFAAIALSACDKDKSTAIKNGLIQDRTWQLVLSLDSKNRFQYSYPRYARMALPGGGGWNGDSLMGMQHLTAVSAISMLHASSKNLLVNAGIKPKALGWLNPKRSPKDVWKKVDDFHQGQFDKLIKEIKRTSKKPSGLPDTLVLIDKLLDNYPHATFASLYDREAASILNTTLSDASRDKVEMPPYREMATQKFLEIAYKKGPSGVDWMKHFKKHNQKKTLKRLTQRVKELGI